jgi:hypothetical protein
VHFSEARKAKAQLPRIPIPRTWVNKGKEAGLEAIMPRRRTS